MNSTTRVPGLIAAMALAALGACGQEPELVEEDYHHAVAAVTAARQERLEIQREFAGLILPRQSSDVGFELGGQVVSMNVDEGDTVSAGQTVAGLDTRLLESERRELDARIVELEARAALNAANLERALELRERGFAAEQQVDELTAEKKTLAANLERVRAGLVANQDRLDKSLLRAPFAGAVSRRFVDQGAVVTAGTPVYRIIETDPLEARVGVPVRLVDRLRIGDRVPVLAAERELDGTIIAIGSDVTRATLTVPVRVRAPQGLGAVPGDQAYVRLRDSIASPGFWLPATAVTDGIRGLWICYALLPDEQNPALHRLEARDVRILYADSARVFVDGALADGERVVAGGLQRLVAGQRVRISGEDAVAQHHGIGSR